MVSDTGNPIPTRRPFNVPPSQFAEVIRCLNEDIMGEYAAVVQYTQHSVTLVGAAYMNIAEELALHAQEELQHASILSELVHYLGGVPTIEVGRRATSPSNIEMLRQDLEGEYAAIRNYNIRVRQLEELGLYDVAEKVRAIAAEEQEHAIDLEMALGIRK